MDALYHRESNEPMRLTVLKKNKDGTVNLGTAGSDPVVTNCPIVEDVVYGSCTLIADAPEPAK